MGLIKSFVVILGGCLLLKRAVSWLVDQRKVTCSHGFAQAVSSKHSRRKTAVPHVSTLVNTAQSLHAHEVLFICCLFLPRICCCLWTRPEDAVSSNSPCALNHADLILCEEQMQQGYIYFLRLESMLSPHLAARAEVCAAPVPCNAGEFFKVSPYTRCRTLVNAC